MTNLADELERIAAFIAAGTEGPVTKAMQLSGYPETIRRAAEALRSIPRHYCLEAVDPSTPTLAVNLRIRPSDGGPMAQGRWHPDSRVENCDFRVGACPIPGRVLDYALPPEAKREEKP